MTFEIGVGAFTICAVALVFGLLTSTFKFPHRTGKAVESLVVESNSTPTVMPMASPSPATSPAPEPSPDALPLTANAPTAPTRPTNPGGPATKPTGSSTPTSTPRVDQPPTIVLSVTPRSGSAPLTVTVDASQSWDTDGTPIANFVFNFGDGTSASPFGGAASVTHTYPVAGIYTLSVVAIDTAGHTSTSFATIAAHPA
jgi:PKD repeat protein